MPAQLSCPAVGHENYGIPLLLILRFLFTKLTANSQSLLQSGLSVMEKTVLKKNEAICPTNFLRVTFYYGNFLAAW
jgi:hypothetical protein